MADITFSWNATNIQDLAATGVEILVRDLSFPLRQAISRHKVEIPGRAGSWDFGGGVKQDYNITIVIAVVGKDIDNIMTTLDSLEAALTDKGDLVLSFKPNVTHKAKIYDEIPVDLEGPGGVALVELNFECDAEPDVVEGS